MTQAHLWQLVLTLAVLRFSMGMWPLQASPCLQPSLYTLSKNRMHHDAVTLGKTFRCRAATNVKDIRHPKECDIGVDPPPATDSVNVTQAGRPERQCRESR